MILHLKAVQISKANKIMPEIRKVTGGKEKSLCKKGKVINLFGYTYILKPFSRFTYLSFVGFVTLIWNFEKCIKDIFLKFLFTAQDHSFRYDLNQIPYDYTVEVRNRFKGLDLIDRVPDELWAEVHDIVQETGIKTIPKKKKCIKAK